MEENKQTNILQQASTLKDEGNRLFVSGNFGDAVDLYERAILLLYPDFQKYEEQVSKKIVNFERKSPNFQDKTETKVTEESTETKPSEETLQSQEPPIPEKKTLSQEVLPEHHSLLSIILGNKAACYSSLNLMEQTVKYCTYSLELDSKYTKALLRRAKAYEALDKLRDALSGSYPIFRVLTTKTTNEHMNWILLSR